MCDSPKRDPFVFLVNPHRLQANTSNAHLTPFPLRLSITPAHKNLPKFAD